VTWQTFREGHEVVLRDLAPVLSMPKFLKYGKRMDKLFGKPSYTEEKQMNRLGKTLMKS